MALSRFNDVRRELFNVGNELKVLNVVTFNYKGKDNNKLDPMYESKFNSEKYTNISELSTLNIRSSEFLVFSYKNKIDDKFFSEEIFISYPHIEALRNFLEEAASYLVSKEQEIYVPNGLTDAGQELVFESPEFASGKKIAIVPAKVDRGRDDKRLMVNGVAILLNEDQYCTWTDLNTFLTMVYLINNEFQLCRDSAMTYIMAQNFELLTAIKNGGGFESSSSNSMNRRSSSGTSATRSIFGNKSPSTPRSVIKRPTNNTNLDEVIDDEDDSNSTKPVFPKGKSVQVNKPATNKNVSLEDLPDLMDDDELPIDEPKETSIKRTVKKNNKKESSDPVISLDDALAMANEDVDLSELDED